MTGGVLPNNVEPRFIEGTLTLENLLGITERAKLIAIEADVTAIRSIEILGRPDRIYPYTFNFLHLKEIHKYLFQDIYSWAGTPRSYDMVKSGDIFTPANKLSKYEEQVFQYSVSLAHSANTDCQPPKSEVIEKLSKSLGLINQYHPFPEGNGRTQRIFISSLSHELGYSMDWASVKPWEMIEVCKRVHEGNYQPMNEMVARIITT